MVQNTPFPSSDTETRSNTRIWHITWASISLYTIYSGRILVYSAYLFVKLAIRVILGAFLFAQYVETPLFKSSEGLFKWGGVRSVQNIKIRKNPLLPGLVRLLSSSLFPLLRPAQKQVLERYDLNIQII